MSESATSIVDRLRRYDDQLGGITSDAADLVEKLERQNMHLIRRVCGLNKRVKNLRKALREFMTSERAHLLEMRQEVASEMRRMCLKQKEEARDANNQTKRS